MKTFFNFLKYQLAGKQTSQASYSQMRRDYITSRGREINLVSKINTLFNPKYPILESEGILGVLEKKDVLKIVSEIRKKGFYVFPNLIPEDKVNCLRNFALKAPVNYLTKIENIVGYSENTVRYEDTTEKSNRYQILDASFLKDSKEILDLVLDKNLLAIANEYLECKPIVDLIVLWWSRALNELQTDIQTKEALRSASAQMFHFDMDRLKFLKFFIYLTDVNEKNGPHVYVDGTHNTLPKYIKSDGRYSDEQIIKNAKSSIREIVGKSGTLIAVDTRGLHKGKELDEGERLIFQLEFTNSLFGNPTLPVISDKFPYNGNPQYFDSYSLFFKK